MPSAGQVQFALPEFNGATRRLVLINLFAYFALLVLSHAAYGVGETLLGWFELTPSYFFHGQIWQPLTYSLVHPTMLGTLFELLSLWFLASFLESYRGAQFVIGIYLWSVLGTAAADILLVFLSKRFGFALDEASLYGCMGAIFGMLMAIGVLYGDVEFLMFFVIRVKARYLAIIYALLAFATLFGQAKLLAFAQIGGALAALLFVRLSPGKSASPYAKVKRGPGRWLSERWFALRNTYYRWKRRRAGRKFEVYMKKQGRTVRLDSRGRQIDDGEDPNDRSRWN